MVMCLPGKQKPTVTGCGSSILPFSARGCMKTKEQIIQEVFNELMGMSPEEFAEAVDQVKDEPRVKSLIYAWEPHE